MNHWNDFHGLIRHWSVIENRANIFNVVVIHPQICLNLHFKTFILFICHIDITFNLLSFTIHSHVINTTVANCIIVVLFHLVVVTLLQIN